jgi:MATE family multidrug resistance protein
MITFASEKAMNIRDKQILNIAVPAIVTNITVPLLGLVDTAIVGHMGDAAYIGAIAVGSMIFNLVYWVFGFLRMGTSGLTAQARGRRDLTELSTLLSRSMLMAGVVALLLIVLQVPLLELMLWLVYPTADVRPLVVTYFHIVIWGAPAVLGLYGLSGWFIGMQSTSLPMVVSIFQNMVNIMVSLWLVYGFGMKVEGVAWGTVIAQYCGLLMAVALWMCYYRRLAPRSFGRLRDLLPFLRINGDIFLRTLFLVAVNLYFTAAGARQGATILAVNALLMQLYLLFSYVMDGFAYAGEALGGRYWGARQWDAFDEVLRRLFGWSVVVTLLFTTIYVVGGMPFLQLLTDEPSVVIAAADYVGWSWLVPVSGVAAFVWDGVFIGITATRGMLLSSVVAALVFFGCTATCIPVMGNHGLWLSMLVYLGMRGVVQTFLFRHRIVGKRA